MKRALIRHGLKTILALVLVVTASSLALPSTTHAGVPIAYKIINENSNKVLSVSGGDPQADGALILQYVNQGSSYQKWNVEIAETGYYSIINVASGDFLDVNGASSSDGASIIQWPSNNGWNQQWELIPTGEKNLYKIKNRASGKLLDISGQSTSDGGQAIQWSDNGGHNQHWYISIN
ncbi:hypothetical protein M2444_000511 [Paenibacillus sp. PastF-3]|uniref:RICIN domain-containing protein n=1 Tax=Paenibacillus sp. PastF-3 TaxID=2940626 RepID=UPI0024768BA9|nr:RICIN domain-containing protein [Paenibacillus sp. PastF-3]MDH6368733.1 hypothetical protein [Paenibacillus sp. PastF-3]